MEDIFLSIGLAFILISVSFFTFTRKSNHDENLPPGSFGWPIIGETLQFLFGKPENFVNYRMKKYSPEIFKTQILGEKTAVICGPKGNKFLFTNEETLFNSFRPHPMQKIFRVNVQKKMERATEKEAVRTPGFFKPEALVRYLGTMDLIVNQHLESQLRGKEKVIFHPISKIFALSLTCRLFLGIDDSDRIARQLVEHFDSVTSGMHSIISNFPGTVFYRAKKSAFAIRKELISVINEKKASMANGAPPRDILSHLVVITKPNIGHEEEIAGKMMGLLVAGYSTVATTITFFMKFVGERPDIYHKVFSEQSKIKENKKSGEHLEWDDFSKMKYSWNVICEVMRLVPPLQGTFREATSDFTYAGYTNPKGWKVYWTVSTTNKDSRYFPKPEKFDPSRYDGENAPPPYTYVPFGGGPRLCPGKEYARLAILTFVHHVVIKYKWDVLIPNEKILGDMMPMPEKGVPIRLHICTSTRISTCLRMAN